MKSHHKFVITVLTLLPAGLLQAQNDPPTRQPQATPPAAQGDSRNQGAANEGDAIFATWLLVANNNEIALARIAQQKAQSPEVKQFAQTMIDEHGQFVQKLQPFGGSNALGDRGAGAGAKTGTGEKTGEKTGNGEKKGQDDGRDTGNAGGGRQPADASSPRSTSTPGSFDHAGLVRDLGKKCLESETKMLSEKTGADFDRCYMQMQVGAHVKMADMIEVFRARSSERLRPTLDAGLKTVQSHLDHAKSLCQKICETGKGAKEEKIGNSK